jgi:hypothetical protein
MPLGAALIQQASVRTNIILQGKLMAASFVKFVADVSRSVLARSRAAPSHEAVETDRISPDARRFAEGRTRASAT